MSNKDLNQDLNQESETETREIVALKLEIEDPETGAVADYHVLDSYYVSRSGRYVQGTFATYVSQRAFGRGRSPVSRGLTVTASEMPGRGADIEQFLYLLAVRTETPLRGAETVFAPDAQQVQTA